MIKLIGTKIVEVPYFKDQMVDNTKDVLIIGERFGGVDVDDIESARKLAIKLRDDEEFYKYCSESSKQYYKQFYGIEKWKTKIHSTL